MQTFESLTVCAPRTSSWSTDIGWKLSPLIGSIFTLSFRSMHGFEATLLSQHPSASSQVLVVASPLQSLHPVCIPVATDDRLHPSAPPWCPIERNYGTKPMVQAGDQIFYTSQCGRRWFATCMKDGLEQAESHPLTLKSEATCQPHASRLNSSFSMCLRVSSDVCEGNPEGKQHCRQSCKRLP